VSTSCRGRSSSSTTRNNKRQGNVHLRPTNTVLAGTAYGRPYQAPFSVR
jgi:dihydroorotase